MKVGIITTSRADYGIYRSLLEALSKEEKVEYGLLVSGTHLSGAHGYTVEDIISDGHPIWSRLPLELTGDRPQDIAVATAKATRLFANTYATLPNLDILIALGDRYEMFAAVAAAIPFNLPVAHLHGGETTLGAIDDKYRHAVTMMSDIHFTATRAYGERVSTMTGSDRVFYVGAPSLDGIRELDLPSTQQLLDRFAVDFALPTVLVTFHPETVAHTDNETHLSILADVIIELSGRYQIVVSLPNADTGASVLRAGLLDLTEDYTSVYCIEHFGKLNYFAAMRDASFMMGNSSSGIIEAASFCRYVINLGDRQTGRARSGNVIDVTIDRDVILSAVMDIERSGYIYKGSNVYYKDGQAGANIVKYITEIFIGQTIQYVR